jgi:hypothetical protein
MYGRNEKDIRKSEEKLKGNCQSVLEGNIRCKIKNCNIFALNYASGHDIYGRPEHSSMAPVVSLTNLAV